MSSDSHTGRGQIKSKGCRLKIYSFIYLLSVGKTFCFIKSLKCKYTTNDSVDL